MMKIRRAHSIFFVLACALAASSAAAPPKSVRLTYGGFMNGMSIGTITEQFESDGATYRIVSDTKPMGLAALIQRQPLRFTSNGLVNRNGLRPLQFEARRTA